MTAAPRATVALVTWRLGGLDLTARGLAQQTYRDFELLVVDAIWYWRRDAVQRWAATLPFAVRHVPDCAAAERGDEEVFYQRENRAHNGAITEARGDVIVYPSDWTILDPAMLAAHVERIDRWGPNCVSLGNYTWYGFDEAVLWPEVAALAAHEVVRDGEVVQDASPYARLVRGLPADAPMLVQSFRAPVANVLLVPEPPIPTLPWDPQRDPAVGSGRGVAHPDGWAACQYVHCKNEGYSADLLRRANGWEESMDGTHTYGDLDMGLRLGRLGARFRFERRPGAMHVTPRRYLRHLAWSRSRFENQRYVEAVTLRGQPEGPTRATRGLDRTGEG